MKRMFLLGAALTLLAGAAYADDQAPATPDATADAPAMAAPDAGMQPPPGPPGMMGPGWGHYGFHRPGMGAGRHPWMGRMMPPGPPQPPSKAAHFVFEGHAGRIDIKCAEDDSTEACAEAVARMITAIAPALRHDDTFQAEPQAAPAQ